jgi:hypothetical protein
MGRPKKPLDEKEAEIVLGDEERIIHCVCQPLRE